MPNPLANYLMQQPGLPLMPVGGPVPKPITPGLSQNVVFDQFRNQKGVNAFGLTEGARPYFGGGTPQVQKGCFPGQYDVSQRLPSGVSARFDLKKTPHGTLDAEVSFTQIGGRGQRGGPYSGKSADPTTGQAISRFNDVFGSIENFVTRVRPGALHFGAGGVNLRRFYDKMAPMMAQRLGGKLKAQGGNYTIEFPNASTYPLKQAP